MKVVRTNRTKARLKAGETVVGASVASAAVELVEVAAVAGLDFVLFDAEHEPLDDAQIADLIRAADAFDITPIVRLAKEPNRILRLLDIGAQGIHVPRCSSVDDMRALAACTRFFPLGERTFYRLGRGGNFNRGLDDDEWARQANEQLLVIAMIEEAAALDHLEAMLQVPGIDAVHIGPKDLWQSMGMPAQPVVEQAVNKIASAVTASGKHLSLQFQGFGDVPGQMERLFARGVNMITIPMLGLLLRETEVLTQKIRDAKGAARQRA